METDKTLCELNTAFLKKMDKFLINLSEENYDEAEHILDVIEAYLNSQLF